MSSWTRIYNSRFDALLPVLRRWRRMVEEHPRRFNDTLSWNRERPQIGFLAAATWLADGAAIEEYSAVKRGRARPGRADLYVNIGRGHFVFEAKHAWLKVGGRGDVEARALTCLRKSLAKAVGDASDGPVAEGRLTALVFVSPFARDRKELDAGHCALRRAVEHLHENEPLCFAAWAEGEAMRWPPRGGTPAWHGGVLVLGRSAG